MITKLLSLNNRTMRGFAITLTTLALLSTVGAQFQILLKNNSWDSQELKQYLDATLFSTRYANINYFEGFIHQPEPRNACSYVEPLPPSFLVNDTQWIALVTDYPSCPDDMVVNVRNAGYGLILTSSVNDSDLDITRNISNSGFPVAVVTDKYAAYLSANASTNSLSQAEVSAEISATLTLSISTAVVIFVLICGCCCCTCCCCLCCWCKCRSDPDQEDRFANQGRQLNYEQVQRQERHARQELIESILRQLQELQVDLRLQVPLGSEETNRLPLRPYLKGEKNNCDSCAICVDEFNEGETLRWLPCDHAFHPQCIDEWLSNHSALCPLCKAEVPRGSQGEARRHPAGARLAGIPIPEMAISDSPSLSSVEESDRPLVSSGHVNQLSRNYGSI